MWDFEALLTDSTPENRAMLANWDQAAAALTELRDAGVPVLWRPFHEFDGRWFWWGKGTPEQFVRLWRMMYRRYTEKFGLNNLIWVLGYSGDVSPGWYVGDEYCDIVGSDTYDNSDHAGGWRKLAFEKIGNKPFTFHECGVLPPFEDFGRDQCMWSWFLIWHTEWIRRNSPEALRTFYNHDGVITLDELPDFTRGQ